jgi:putative membrane protein
MERILSEKELTELSHVVADIEKKTSGELRLMIVGRSAPIGHVYQLLFVAFLYLLTISYLIAREELWIGSGYIYMIAILPLALALSWVLARVPRIQRFVTNDEDLTASVWARAELEFNREGLNGTKAQTGVLIFLSLMEHQAVVLADKGIASKLDAKIWKDVVDIVLQGARGKQWRAKLEEALRLCGKLLAQEFPAHAGDVNELPNHVIVKP